MQYFPRHVVIIKKLQGGRRYAKIIFVDRFPCHFLLEYSCSVLCCIEMEITSRQGIIIFIISSIHHQTNDVLSLYISIILPINKSLKILGSSLTYLLLNFLGVFIYHFWSEVKAWTLLICITSSPSELVCKANWFKQRFPGRAREVI